MDFGIEDLPRGSDAPKTHVAGRLGDNLVRREAQLPFQPSDLAFEDPTLQAMLDGVLERGRRHPRNST